MSSRWSTSEASTNASKSERSALRLISMVPRIIRPCNGRGYSSVSLMSRITSSSASNIVVCFAAGSGSSHVDNTDKPIFGANLITCSSSESMGNYPLQDTRREDNAFSALSNCPLEQTRMGPSPTINPAWIYRDFTSHCPTALQSTPSFRRGCGGGPSPCLWDRGTRRRRGRGSGLL
jgi:hypothetical protein